MKIGSSERYGFLTVAMTPPIYIEWLENIYFPTNIKRLREHLEMTIEWLKKNGLSFIRPTGGLYIYVNFSKVRRDTKITSVIFILLVSK